MDTPSISPLGANYSITTKLVAVGFMVVVCMVPTVFVGVVLSERENRQKEVVKEISDKWGASQVIAGPALFLPYRKVTVDTQNVSRVTLGVLTVLPDKLHYAAAVEPEIRSRSIFDAVVYKTAVQGSGEFAAPDFSSMTIASGDVEWGKAYIAVGISDTRGITERIHLKWNGSEIPFEPGSKNSLLGNNGIHAFTPFDAGARTASFAFALNIQGSEKLEFVPLGNETKVDMRSSWKTPSFDGAYLPAERSVAEGFTANWSVSSFGRAYPQQWLDQEVEQKALMDSKFGASLIRGVDFYTQISRTIKYAILFIAITFLAFFLFEILSKLRIHPFQYLLVGCALALFYLLLLSLSERIGFLPAYAVSMVAIVGLITSYCAKILRAQTKALIVAGLLLLLYSYLYVIIQLEDLALLYGAILLFMLLALTMYLTRNIDWYQIETGDRRQN